MRFVFVDQILSLEPGKTIKALKHINFNEPYLNDHFPGFPVVPGNLLTEMMGQATEICLEAEDNSRGKPMLAKITSANFRGMVKPGNDCMIYSEVIRNRPKFAIAHTYVDVNQEKVCSAELLFTFMEIKQIKERPLSIILKDYMRDKT